MRGSPAFRGDSRAFRVCCRTRRSSCQPRSRERHRTAGDRAEEFGLLSADRSPQIGNDVAMTLTGRVAMPAMNLVVECTTRSGTESRRPDDRRGEGIVNDELAPAAWRFRGDIGDPKGLETDSADRRLTVVAASATRETSMLQRTAFHVDAGRSGAQEAWVAPERSREAKNCWVPAPPVIAVMNRRHAGGEGDRLPRTARRRRLPGSRSGRSGRRKRE